MNNPDNNMSAARPITKVIFHIHETATCINNCRGCYLKGIDKRKYNIDHYELIRRIYPALHEKDLSITTVRYHNYGREKVKADESYRTFKGIMLRGVINPDISDDIKEFIGHNVNSNKTNCRSILVTDSISLITRFDVSRIIDCYDDVTISPKSRNSLTDATSKIASLFVNTKSGIKRNLVPTCANLLFTVGVDDTDLLVEAIEMGYQNIHLNMKKPVTSDTLIAYQAILLELERLRGDGRLATVVPDSCHEYIKNGRDCANPDDGILELTTFYGSYKYYTCAYPYTECFYKDV